MEGDLRSLEYSDPRAVLTAVDQISQCYIRRSSRIGQYVTATEIIDLLAVSGTIPLHSRTRGKAVPAIIWMPKQFPQEPPSIYIEKPKDCFINPASHLDPSGMVQHDYLRQWNQAQSSLKDFIQILIVDFTRNLPLFSLENFNVPKRVRDNIDDLLMQFPDLVLDLQLYGNTEMLVIDGTLEVVERGMSHTRRVDLWLPASFPTGPPWVYVHPSDGSTPTPGTAAYSQCNIDMPYLRDWHYKESCLQILMNVVIIKLSEITHETLPRSIHDPKQESKRKTPPWMRQTGHHDMPREEDEAGYPRDDPASNLPDSTLLSKRPQPQPRKTKKSSSEASTSGIIPMSPVSNLTKQDDPPKPSAKSTPKLIEFAVKAGLSNDTVQRLAGHGFTGLRPVLVMNDGDLEALNLPEMAQKVLLREGIKRLQHMADDCSNRSKSTDIAQSDIPLTMDDILNGAVRAQFADYVIDERQINLGEEIGRGQYGIVYKGTYDNPRTHKQEVIAIKKLYVSSAEKSRSSVDSFTGEILKMRQLKHKHIMELKGIVFKLRTPCCIMRYMENGDLRSYLLNPQKTFTSPALLTLALQVATGMKYLSDHHFIHGDLAARNCLVDASETVKISDFGMSRELFRTDYFRLNTTIDQRVRWMAVEAFTLGKCTQDSDRWSFGVVLWEITTRGETPYSDMSNREVVLQIRDNGYRMPRPDKIHESVYTLMLACWEDDGSTRPNFYEICTTISRWITPGAPENRSKDYPSYSGLQRDVRPTLPPREPLNITGNTTSERDSARSGRSYLDLSEICPGNGVVEQSNRTGPARCPPPNRASPNSQGTANATGSEETVLEGISRSAMHRRPVPPPPLRKTDVV